MVQERGGPCGVMAAVQGALLQTLNFGSMLEGGGGCKVRFDYTYIFRILDIWKAFKHCFNPRYPRIWSIEY